MDLVGVIHTFLTVLRHQRGREVEKEYGGGCSGKRRPKQLRVDKTKVELFEFLTNEVTKRSHAK